MTIRALKCSSAFINIIKNFDSINNFNHVHVKCFAENSFDRISLVTELNKLTNLSSNLSVNAVVSLFNDPKLGFLISVLLLILYVASHISRR